MPEIFEKNYPHLIIKLKQLMAKEKGNKQNIQSKSKKLLTETKHKRFGDYQTPGFALQSIP